MMEGVSYMALLTAALPELILTVTMLGALGVDLFILREQPVSLRYGMGAVIASVGLAAAAACVVMNSGERQWLDGMLVQNRTVQLLKVALLALGFFSILLGAETRLAEHAGEFLALMLLALLGMMFMVGTENLLLMFIALELSSLSLYVLTGMNRDRAGAADAALRFFLIGGVSAGFTLFGISLLFGGAHSLEFRQVASALTQSQGEPLLLIGVLFVVTGFGFKTAAVPFHLWAPPVYAQSPIPAAALISSGSKLAAFYLLARFLGLAVEPLIGQFSRSALVPGWAPLLVVMAVASMAIGNLAALSQTHVRRLLAWSAVGHAGFLLLGVIVHVPDRPAPLVYYLVTYGLSTVGAFGVVAVVERAAGGSRLTDFTGFFRRSPLLSICLGVFLLSFAGIPPLAGFFGKFFIFSALLQTHAGLFHWMWLLVVAVAFSAISLFYYLLVLKQVFVVHTEAELKPLGWSPGVVAVLLLALGVVALGVWPGLLLQFLPG